MHADLPHSRRSPPRLPSVVTKKRRRSQLARASAQRQQLRRAQRARRRKRVRTVVALVAAVTVAAVLVLWILLHARDSGSTPSAWGDYASVVDLSQHHAPTAEGAR